jgi:hypothetical protein
MSSTDQRKRLLDEYVASNARETYGAVARGAARVSGGAAPICSGQGLGALPFLADLEKLFGALDATKDVLLSRPQKTLEQLMCSDSALSPLVLEAFIPAFVFSRTASKRQNTLVFDAAPRQGGGGTFAFSFPHSGLQQPPAFQTSFAEPRPIPYQSPSGRPYEHLMASGRSAASYQPGYQPSYQPGSGHAAAPGALPPTATTGAMSNCSYGVFSRINMFADIALDRKVVRQLLQQLSKLYDEIGKMPGSSDVPGVVKDVKSKLVDTVFAKSELNELIQRLDDGNGPAVQRKLWLWASMLHSAADASRRACSSVDRSIIPLPRYNGGITALTTAYVLDDASLFKGLVLKCTATMKGVFLFPVNVQPLGAPEEAALALLGTDADYSKIGLAPAIPFFTEASALYRLLHSNGDTAAKVRENAADYAAVMQVLSDYFGVVLPMYSVYAVWSELAGLKNLWVGFAGAKPLSAIRDEITKAAPASGSKDAPKKVSEAVRRGRSESGFDTALTFFSALKAMVVSEYWLRKSDGDDLVQAALQNLLAQVLAYQNDASIDVSKALAGFAA